MTERRKLTAEFVHSVLPPLQGERWIADTKVRGFGLRTWASKSRGNKAFAIRVANRSGKVIRKTFDVEQGWSTKLDIAYGGRPNAHGLGEYLEDARAWARDEIDRAKGRATIAQEDSIRRKRVGEVVKDLTLEGAARSLLSGMRVNGRSEKYLDRLDKLFANSVPRKLKRTPLSRISSKSIGRTLAKAKLSGGNARIMRTFIGKIFDQGGQFHFPLLRIREEFHDAFRVEWRKTSRVRFPKLNKLKDSAYEKVFLRLESEETYWQSAHTSWRQVCRDRLRLPHQSRTCG